MGEWDSAEKHDQGRLPFRSSSISSSSSRDFPNMLQTISSLVLLHNHVDGVAPDELARHLVTWPILSVYAAKP
jgi:hypothetical protein